VGEFHRAHRAGTKPRVGARAQDARPTNRFTLLVFTRQIFPHAKLDDAVYALVVKDLDAEAAANADVKKLLTDGAAGLDKAAGGSFAAATKEKQAEITASPRRHLLREGAWQVGRLAL
jgi:hypothetical protein